MLRYIAFSLIVSAAGCLNNYGIDQFRKRDMGNHGEGRIVTRRSIIGQFGNIQAAIQRKDVLEMSIAVFKYLAEKVDEKYKEPDTISMRYFSLQSKCPEVLLISLRKSGINDVASPFLGLPQLSIYQLSQSFCYLNPSFKFALFAIGGIESARLNNGDIYVHCSVFINPFIVNYYILTVRKTDQEWEVTECSWVGQH